MNRLQTKQQTQELIPQELVQKFDNDQQLVQEFLNEGYSISELQNSEILHPTQADPMVVLKDSKHVAGFWIGH